MPFRFSPTQCKENTVFPSMQILISVRRLLLTAAKIERRTHPTCFSCDSHLEFNSILALSGSNRFFVSVLCFSTLLIMSVLCVCAFFVLRYHYHQQSYSTDHEAGRGEQADLCAVHDDFSLRIVSKSSCCCYPQVHTRCVRYDAR